MRLLNEELLHSNLGVRDGHLTFAGYDTVELCEKYGTPLMLLDEGRIRHRMRLYRDAMAEYFGEGSYPLYASKALSFRGMYTLAAQEGIGTDIVSVGELYIAHGAGFPLEKAFFHGNCKTDADIAYAMDVGIGYFVVDTQDELSAISRISGEKGITQKILLRLSPGIDPHTHKAISTGSVDSKFGTAIETGQALALTRTALATPAVSLEGFHCHIGSQIFELQPFCDAASVMLSFVGEVARETGFCAPVLNLGGGFGVRYTADQPEMDYRENIRLLADFVAVTCTRLGIPQPRILMEPGRSIVADSGMTLYRVGSIKEITGYKNYVAVDGGMTDNPRYALYEAPYTVYLANRMDEAADYPCTLAGRCCESGDILQENITLPRPRRGDTVAVAVTGAYNYSMASNYNRVPRPPIVLLGDVDRLAVRRETPADVAALDEPID